MEYSEPAANKMLYLNWVRAMLLPGVREPCTPAPSPTSLRQSLDNTCVDPVWMCTTLQQAQWKEILVSSRRAAAIVTLFTRNIYSGSKLTLTAISVHTSKIKRE